MPEAAKMAYRLSRIFAEGWNCARTASSNDGIASNPYATEPERTRWQEGYADASSWKPQAEGSWAMIANIPVSYRGFQITIAQDKTRFTARVIREDGGLISHDGRNSEIWASESCGSYDRAVWLAKNLIDIGKVS
jgi:hypothetical protein